MTDIQDLLGLGPTAQSLSNYIQNLAGADKTISPEVKSYSDVVYFNYFDLGLSLLFVPVDGYKLKTGMQRSELEDDQLVLDSLDVYNIPSKFASTKSSKRKAELAFSTFPACPFGLKRAETSFLVEATTDGKQFLQSLGEPDRKGGGAGPSSGSIGIWCEWSKDGILVEFGGDEARGPQAWERGKDAIWQVLTVFRPKF
ncbi:hypothetical protein C8J56DRAFT_918571 [Mycena floridula]|nr:hypothetical protein C8J56DRAFT_918571 [Mycena floridula]